MRKLAAGTVCLLLALTQASAAAEPVAAEGKVDRVTLYRGQALVSRLLKAQVPAGTAEVLVSPLPEQVVGSSLFAESADDLQVRAVRYRERAVEEEPREDVRKIRSSLQKLQAEFEHNQLKRDALQRRQQYLEQMEQFAPATARQEMAAGVLDAETLKTLTLFLFEQRGALADREFELEQKREELTEQRSLLRRKLDELTRDVSRTVREAVVTVHSAGAGPASLRLSYLVREAGWEPTYSVRASGADRTVRVDYSAVVHQMSGEDWGQVEMVLSTASPALRAQSPELAPFWVRLAPKPPAFGRDVADVRRGLKATARRRITAAEPGESAERAWQMNVQANLLQNIEIGRGAQQKGRRTEPGAEEGLSATYELPSTVSLPSRRDRQTVEIASLELPSNAYHLAIPLLTEFVYREASLTNDSDLPLLEGEAAVYLGGQFVGRTELPMAAVGESFPVGLGVDSQLRADREQISREVETLGANKQVTTRFRLTLENHKDESVVVRLYDRIPHPAEGQDLRVTLGEISDPLSEDPFYLENERPKGILRWEVEVPPGAAGAEARAVEYGYTVEFDRKLHVSTPFAARGGVGGGGFGAALAEERVQAQQAAPPEEAGKLRQEFQRLMKQKRSAR